MRNFKSYDEKVNFQLENQYAEIQKALDSFAAGMLKAREKSKDFIPEKRKPLLQETAKPLIDSVLKALDESTKNVDGRFQRVATSLQAAVTNSKTPRTELGELLHFLKVDAIKRELQSMSLPQRDAVFSKALNDKNDIIIDAFRDTLQPLAAPPLLESGLSEYDNEKLNAIAPGESELLSVLSDARSEIKRSVDTVRGIIIDELAADGIRPQDFSTVGSMTTAEKSDFVDKHGLQAFQKMVDGF